MRRFTGNRKPINQHNKEEEERVALEALFTDHIAQIAKTSKDGDTSYDRPPETVHHHGAG